MARKHGVLNAEDLLPPELRGIKDEADVKWMIRMPLLKIKPIISSNADLILKSYLSLKKAYPNLHIFVFKIAKGQL